MAMPITHVALAAKVFDKSFPDKTRKDFFIGTLFPDIRYLEVIDRSKTHFSDLKIIDLEKEDSFSAGIKFHSILDVAREKFIVANNVYALCPRSQYSTPSLKIVEDIIFYERIADWGVYIKYLNEILPSEENFGIAKKDIQKWHVIMQQYFKKQPDEQTVANFIPSIGFSDKVAREINENVVKMKANKKIIDILNNLYENFDALVA